MYIEISRVTTTDHVSGKQQCEFLGTFAVGTLPRLGEQVRVKGDTLKVVEVTHQVHDLKTKPGSYDTVVNAVLLVE